jgi:hypothetical protein
VLLELGGELAGAEGDCKLARDATGRADLVMTERSGSARPEVEGPHDHPVGDERHDQVGTKVVAGEPRLPGRRPSLDESRDHRAALQSPGDWPREGELLFGVVSRLAPVHPDPPDLLAPRIDEHEAHALRRNQPTQGISGDHHGVRERGNPEDREVDGSECLELGLPRGSVSLGSVPPGDDPRHQEADAQEEPGAASPVEEGLGGAGPHVEGHEGPCQDP